MLIRKSNAWKSDTRLAKHLALDWSRLVRMADARRKISHSIVIPALNESDRIGLTIEDIYKFMPQKYPKFELIVVDDGSQDDTRAVVGKLQGQFNNLMLTPERQNLGKGFSVKQGMLASRGDLRLFMDADGSTHIRHLEFLMSALDEGFDIVIGSRNIEGANIAVRQPWYREQMGRTFNFCVKWLAGINYEDTQCGFKLFSADAADMIFSRQKMDRFAFDVELLYLASKFGLKVAEFPVTWLDCPRSKVNPLTAPINMFMDVLRVRWMHWGEKYSHDGH
ncbi:MAG: dolichyl-phosphate beta-glucosyltransferase [Candidatus Margulisiibacteriota bacterium]